MWIIWLKTSEHSGLNAAASWVLYPLRSCEWVLLVLTWSVNLASRQSDSITATTTLPLPQRFYHISATTPRHYQGIQTAPRGGQLVRGSSYITRAKHFLSHSFTSKMVFWHCWKEINNPLTSFCPLTEHCHAILGSAGPITLPNYWVEVHRHPQFQLMTVRAHNTIPSRANWWHSRRTLFTTWYLICY